MGHIRDQSPTQRAIQALLRGLSQGAQSFSAFNQGQIDRDFEKQQLADVAGRRASKGEAALSKALLDREFEGVQQRATARHRATTTGQAQERIGISQGNLELAIKRFEAQKSRPRGAEGPPRTRSQIGVDVDRQLGVQRRDILGRAEEATGPTGGLVQNLSDLRIAAQQGLAQTRPSRGFFTTEFGAQPDPDPTISRLLQEFLKIGSPESRLATRDSLSFLRPDVFGGGQVPQQQPLPGGINLKNLSDEELERLARGEQ